LEFGADRAKASGSKYAVRETLGVLRQISRRVAWRHHGLRADRRSPLVGNASVTGTPAEHAATAERPIRIRGRMVFRSTGCSVQPVEHEIDHRGCIEREQPRNDQPANDGDPERASQLRSGGRARWRAAPRPEWTPGWSSGSVGTAAGRPRRSPAQGRAFVGVRLRAQNRPA
jgi:hypothetical protein